jgi:hypothetical protein
MYGILVAEKKTYPAVCMPQSPCVGDMGLQGARNDWSPSSLSEDVGMAVSCIASKGERRYWPAIVNVPQKQLK